MSEIGLFGQEITDRKNKNDFSFVKAMDFFKDTSRTESSFYLRFQVIPVDFLDLLESYFNTSDSWKLFSEILKYYNVKSA